MNIRFFILNAVVILLAATLSFSATPRNIIPSRFTVGHIPIAFIKVGSKTEVENGQDNIAGTLISKAMRLPGASIVKAWMGWGLVIVPMVKIVFSSLLNPLFQDIVHGKTMKLGIVLSITLALIFADSSEKSSKVFLSDAGNSVSAALERASERGSMALERASERGSTALERIFERVSNTILVIAGMHYIGYLLHPLLFPREK
jgi:hypothetical protein